MTDRLRELPALGFTGLNVTLTGPEQVRAFADDVLPALRES